MPSLRIAHLTSVHARGDTRIFIKMCNSMSLSHEEIYLVVCDGKGGDISGNVKIFDVGFFGGRLARIFKASRSVFYKAIEINADLYHFHDPELIPIGLKLKRFGKKVIFDSHEDVPKQLLSKPYLSKHLLWIISRLYKYYEAWACAKFDGIIAATPYIRDKFLKINSNCVDINNFPLLEELNNQSPWSQKCNEVCYVGGIGSIRGIEQVCDALALLKTNARLNLVGNFSDKATRHKVVAGNGWVRVNELGFLNRVEVAQVLERSLAGIVTFLPLPNHIDSQPNKMFEYMSAGIPVIASDFPLWREIIAGNDCGLLVDPLDPQAIADAIDYLIQNPNEAERLGRNGRNAVLKKYNWPIEEKKLLDFYSMILSGKTPTT
jgi:glycosyltransferase involved in cell wall biosynthesis